MEDEVERLRAMLNIQALCEKREDFELDLTPDTTSGTNPYLSSDPDDDEKVLSYEHRVGGRLENAVGYAKGEATIQFRLKVILLTNLMQKLMLLSSFLNTTSRLEKKPLKMKSSVPSRHWRDIRTITYVLLTVARLPDNSSQTEISTSGIGTCG